MVIKKYKLRSHIYKDYNKYIRPVNNYNDIRTIIVNMGIAVRNLESFNQIYHKKI